jgi:hypothetical protein
MGKVPEGTVTPEAAGSSPVVPAVPSFSGLESFLRLPQSQYLEKEESYGRQLFDLQVLQDQLRLALLQSGLPFDGKIKPNVVIVSGVEERNIEKVFLNFNSQWIDVGVDPIEAQRRRQLRLNQREYQRLSNKTSVAATVGRLNVVEFRGRRVIKDEVDAYLADLELTRRLARTVQSKRRYLGDFVGLIGKEFADEYRREDVLKYKNKLQDKGFEPKTIDTRMMAVVTFFNRWLKIKLGLNAKDWPETHDNDPEPYTDDEAAKLEDASLGEINLLIRTFQEDSCSRTIKARWMVTYSQDQGRGWRLRERHKASSVAGYLHHEQAV